MPFKKIATIDNCGLVGPFRDKVLGLSQTPVTPATDDPTSEEQIVARIGDADCALVSWRTQVPGSVLRACPSLKYVGMCCSLYDEDAANVDIREAKKLGITVTGVKDYGDDGTLEFIFAELISLYKGLGPRKWSEDNTELTSKTLGIVGLGFLGKMVARAALLFGMKVLYNSRTRKPDMEELGCEYAEFGDLLARADVVTAHLPRNTVIFDAAAFKAMKERAIFVNTSLGQPFVAEAFFDWIGKKSGNFAIFDMPGSGTVTARCKDYPNIVLYERPSGFTSEARERLTAKVYDNMVAFLDKK